MVFSKVQLDWLHQIFLERFGVSFIFETTHKSINLKLRDCENKIIFTNFDMGFHQFSNSNLNCYSWDAEKEGLQGIIMPILKAPSTSPLPPVLINFNEYRAIINYDILGLIYWMLNRLEEIGRVDLDGHQRFFSANSHASKYNYLERPIVDEWLDIVKQVIQRVWPNIKLKEHQFNMIVSHDVDRPSRYGFSSLPMLLKSIVGDVFKRKNFLSIFQALSIRLNTKNKLHKDDVFNTFSWIMDLSEENNFKSAFYFICGKTDLKKDGNYDIEHPAMRELMRNIYNRGHEIGLHPSYNTYQDSSLINEEFRKLRRICDTEGIKQKVWGGRMHYLRWEHPTTMQAWNDAGLTYDSTLSYADRPGFRCGTCFEYPAFNPITQQKLALRIRPLIVMECSIMAKGYLGLGYGDQALSRFLKLKNICRKVNGSFTLLWHNSELDTNLKKEMYKRVIS